MTPETASKPCHLRVVDSREGVDFETLYSRFSKRVATVGLRIMGRTNDLDDYVQDVFIEVHRALHTLADPNAVKFWIDRIAVRMAVRRVRNLRWKRLIPFADDDPVLELEDTGASPEEQVLLGATLAKLSEQPARARACWMLRVVEGYGLNEVAEAVGCSLATVKRDVARVAKALEADR